MTTGTRLLLGVMALALALRLVALSCTLPQLKPEVDLDDYRNLARNLAAGHGFVVTLPDGRQLPSAERTLGYPLFLASLIRLGGDRLGLFLAAQCVVGSLTCGLTVLLAGRWLAPRAAAAAGLLVALDPNSIVRCLDLRTETVFTLFLVGGAVLLAWRADRFGSVFAAGVCWSLAALIRPIALFLPLAALIVWPWPVAASAMRAESSPSQDPVPKESARWRSQLLRQPWPWTR